MTDSQCSILDRLPRELRDMIWKEALFRDVIDITPTGCSQSHPASSTPEQHETPNTAKPQTRNRAIGTPISSSLTALLRTCHQVRDEATCIFFAHNTFQISISETTLSHPARWLSSLPGESRSRIRNFTVIFGAGNQDLFSKLMRETTSFDSTNMSLFVDAPRKLREKNLQVISSALAALKCVGYFKHTAIRFQFDRQTAGMWEWVSWRHCWSKVLGDMSDTFTMPGRDEIGCYGCRRMGCRPRISCNCGQVVGEEAGEA